MASSTDDVTLACVATTDARRAAHLRVTWYRDELPVSDEGRVRATEAGSRLVIDDATVSDSGVYGCTATNGIDQDSAVVAITIKGLPPKRVDRYTRLCLPSIWTGVHCHECPAII